MNPAVARRFPLIARPRPACTPLDQRVSELQARADLAQEHRDVASASAVFNLAALLASDCGMADLARTWCHRLAAVALAHDSEPRHALEPVVNLARLYIRAGDGPAAWNLLEGLFRAIDTRTDITIDGIAVPAALLTDTPEAHLKARTWLWTVLLGTGAHALAAAGRWDEASERLSQYKGDGARMLDGRQVSVIAHATAGRHRQARAVLAATQPGEPWENAVTACLALHVFTDDPADSPTTALSTFHALGSAEPGLTVFHIRLGLTIIDALDDNHPAREQVAVTLINQAASDGYAARDLLNHPGRHGFVTGQQLRRLAEVVSDCGLDLGTMPEIHLASLGRALDTAESVIAYQGRRRPHQSA